MDIKSFDFKTLTVLKDIYIDAKITCSSKEPISSFGKTEKLVFSTPTVIHFITIFIHLLILM